MSIGDDTCYSAATTTTAIMASALWHFRHHCTRLLLGLQSGTRGSVSLLNTKNDYVFAARVYLKLIRRQELSKSTYSEIDTKAKILLKFFYMVGICKLEVMGTITW